MRPVDAVTPVVAGHVRIKEAQVAGRGPILLRHIRTMLSRSWTSVLPIYCWVIDHPDGRLLVDTGPRPTPDWTFPRYHPYYPLSYRTRAGPAGGLTGALDDRGHPADTIDAVILTHCHPDHAEGLGRIPDTVVYIEEGEYAHARSLMGRFWGSHPSLAPTTDRAFPVGLDDGPIGPFDRSHRFDAYPGITLIPTPGHTANHCSVVVEGEGPTVVLAADACLSLDQLETQQADGVATRVRAGRDTLARLDRWRREEDIIILPSHDPRGLDHLANARSQKG